MKNVDSVELNRELQLIKHFYESKLQYDKQNPTIQFQFSSNASGTDTDSFTEIGNVKIIVVSFDSGLILRQIVRPIRRACPEPFPNLNQPKKPEGSERKEEERSFFSLLLF